MAKFDSIDDYIHQLPAEVRGLAISVRDTINTSDARLTEAIRYNIPAFRLGKETVIYFAFWTKHVGLYPIYRGTDEFEALVQPYRAKTDTVQFKFNQPIPHDLIATIVASEISGRHRGTEPEGTEPEGGGT